MSAPYEAPENPEIHIQGDVVEDVRALIAERKKPFDQMPSEQDGGVLTKNIVLESK